ncbi:MAG: Smr/MutS family protein [Spirochaetia bacterium]|jgi:DNA mismatch repair protein MutS2|nr:Smr/MutS family protein [Spirochaetia bacterium]
MFFSDEHSLSLLDFPRIRENVASYCLSEEGRGLVRAALPIDDGLRLRAFALDLDRLARYLEAHSLPGFSFPSIHEALNRLARPGSSLEMEELLSLGHWSRNFESLTAFLSKVSWERLQADGAGIENAEGAERSEAAELESFDPERLAAVWAEEPAAALIDRLPKLQDVYKIIFNVISPEGELRELPELKRLNDAIRKKNRELLRLASSYGRDPELRAALQSEEPTQRDGRTVLAVRANFKGRVRGIVHEASSTGQTLFIEPEALVEKNNELVRLDARLKAEVLRIFRETSDTLRPFYAELCRARESLAYLDQRLARVLMASREELLPPELDDQGLTLWRARHPLLGKKAVPIDVDLPEDTRMLIITGPNTGGKTVTLKTIGLFALMRQFGLWLPFAQGSSLPIFDAVLVDIGDEQSIDQSLSTFSGHMKVIAGIAAKASAKSLILLDELGAGTDPEEGCALAMGLLDYFIDLGALTIITTHHGILKNYGYTKPGCLNASMEFDSTRLAPTYRIVMGIPGQSRALEVAAQVGLPGIILDAARQYLDEERSDIGELVKSLSEKQRAIEQLEREQRRRIQSTVEDRRKLDLAALQVRQKEQELRRRGVAELKNLLNESRKTLENLIRELRESKGGQESVIEAKRFLSQLAESVENQAAALVREETAIQESLEQEASETRDFSEGDEVLYGANRRRARAVRKAAPGQWLIELGSLRLTVSAAELLPARKKTDTSPGYDVELAPREGGEAPKAKFELDLRGFRLHEALEAVERQIDAASLQGLKSFSIIHGTGEGILGKGIHDYLRDQGAVEDYHFARPEEGGYGKTQVRLK